MPGVNVPETRYAKTADGVSIAYQVTGTGPPDFVVSQATYTANVDLVWEWPDTAKFLHGVAARGRLLLFDRRGMGLSDRVSGDHLPTLEARMDDIRAVMDASGSDRAIVAGWEDGAALSFLFAATYPDRVAALISFQPASRGSWAPDAPWLDTDQAWAEWFEELETSWGTPEFVRSLVQTVFPTRAQDPEFARSYWRAVRHSITKADAIATDRMWKDTDIRHVLPTIQAPTLVIYNVAIHDVPAEESRYIAEHIPGAVFVQVEPTGDDLWEGTFPHIDRFLTSLRAEDAQFDRVLATVLFTDVVGSTAKSAQMGDTAWKGLLDRHHQVVRAMLGRYRGTEVSTAGDGFLATFDGPARGVRCAQAIAGAVQSLGLEIRAGLHAGEIELAGDDVRGIAVHIGARVGALAGPSEVLVSQTVRDLVAGSGLTFEDAGEHELKGVPDRWRLYRVVG
jgi:class 3 adenylate cyclase/pimeloyl-ACP methyl ester carboxylesterase